MALAYTVEDIESVPEAVRGEYVKTEAGVYQLDVPGVVPKSKLDEFRDNNINLRKEHELKSAELTVRINQLENINGSYTNLGEDPEAIAAEIAELKALKEKVDNNELIAAEGFDEALNKKLDKRVNEMREGFETKIRELEEAKTAETTELSTKLSSVEQRYRQVALEGVLRDEAVKAGALPESVDDILARASRSGWTIGEDGGAVAVKDGEPIYGNSGEKLTIKEWVGSLKKDASWFFKPNTGGGAGGDAGGTPPSTGPQPLTPAELSKLSPQEYAAYRNKSLEGKKR